MTARLPSADPTLDLLLLVGLTGVGKSTAVNAVLGAVPGAQLLPNRRALADAIVIPEAQRAAGEPVVEVRDRLERFRLSDRYREDHPGGMAHALECYLADQGAPVSGTLVFDNLRGEEEVGHARHTFPSARYVVLEAPVPTRVLRLAGRNDAFDRVASADPATESLIERLAGVPGLRRLTDVERLAGAAAGLDPDAVVTGARVVAEESLYYDPAATWAQLAPLPDRRRLRLDTSVLDADRVAALLLDWL